MAEVHIVVFAKAPVPGRVKTRLLDRLTPDEAALLHRAMVMDTAELIAGLPLPADRLVLFDQPVDDVSLPLGTGMGQQRGAGLSERLTHAFRQAFGARASGVIALGSDSPHLPQRLLLEAIEAVRSHDAVLGPAEDGGYYLVGLRAREGWERVFQGIDWGSERVLGQTAAAISAARLSLAMLPGWYDLDRWEDLARLAQEGAECRRTLTLARRWVERDTSDAGGVAGNSGPGNPSQH